MKKYEYKFMKFSSKLGFDFDNKCDELERQWNELGNQGWMFCKEGNGFIIFIREVNNSDI